MRKAVFLLAAVASSFAGFVGTGRADAPIRDVMDVNVTFPSRFWTRACGLPVLQTLEGRGIAKLYTAADGSAREIDTFPNFRNTLTAPTTGHSFTLNLGPVISEYPEGVFVGAPAIVTTVGNASQAPGMPPDAGRVTYEGVIVFFEPSGIPLVDFGPPAISATGRSNDPAAEVAAICAALAG